MLALFQPFPLAVKSCLSRKVGSSENHNRFSVFHSIIISGVGVWPSSEIHAIIVVRLGDSGRLHYRELLTTAPQHWAVETQSLLPYPHFVWCSPSFGGALSPETLFLS
jgi:hypothetical protein